MVRRLAVLALTGCLLAGCGGGSKEPKSDPTPSPIGPSSSTPTAAPTMPDAAKANTKAGAIAFVKYYIDAFNHAQATGDTTLLTSLGSSACQSCKDVASTADAIYRRGGRITGGRWTVAATEVHRSVDGQWVVDVAGRVAPSEIYSAPDTNPKHSSGGRSLTSFFVRFKNDWQVERWSRAE